MASLCLVLYQIPNTNSRETEYDGHKKLGTDTGRHAMGHNRGSVVQEQEMWVGLTLGVG